MRCVITIVIISFTFFVAFQLSDRKRITWPFRCEPEVTLRGGDIFLISFIVDVLFY